MRENRPIGDVLVKLSGCDHETAKKIAASQECPNRCTLINRAETIDILFMNLGNEVRFKAECAIFNQSFD
jgi:hypothetical protein